MGVLVGLELSTVESPPSVLQLLLLLVVVEVVVLVALVVLLVVVVVVVALVLEFELPLTLDTPLMVVR